VIATGLEMLSVNKQVGFLSDAYFADWAYAKAMIVRKQLARVLAEKIEQGQFNKDAAVEIGHAIFFEAPQSLCNVKPKAYGQDARTPRNP
jgi:hypothetical protein